ncbi:DUF6409 family protein [Streptomyces jumonjinensis]|uniref:DUF6409 family protein n=1 Tax=Streptomyces jumonjinensis TaxID=1945 RepID=UPI00332CF696
MTTTYQTPVTTAQDFPAATFVLGGPWERGNQIDPRPAVVVGSFGGRERAAETSPLVVWFFSGGAPEPGPTVQAMFPHELTPIGDTLTTMDGQAFRVLAASLHRGRFAYDDGDELRAAVRQAWRERTGLTDADPAAQYTCHRG